MPKQTIQVQSPIRGVDRSKGREAQPDSSVFDALNVLPYDRTGRIRAGQRAGTAALFAAITAKTINGLYQVTLDQTSADPDGGGVGASIFDDAFVYANGALGGHGSWTTDGGDTSWTVETDFLVLHGVGDRANRQTTRLSTFDMTAGFVLEVDLDFSGNTGDVGHYYFQVFLTDSVTTEFLVDFTETAAGVCDVTMSTPSGGTTIVSGVAFTRGTVQTVTATYDPVAQTWAIAVAGYGVIATKAATTPPTSAAPTLYLTGGMSVGVDSQLSIFEVKLNGLNVAVAQPRATRLIATSDQSVWVGTTSGLSSLGGATLAHSKPSITDFDRHVYIVDGTSTFDLNYTTLASPAIAAMVATAGSVPSGCRVARTWRGRLVLAAADADPQNYFFARVGTPTDWDFSQTDAAAAFAGNDSQAGRVSDLILDMIPFTNDTLIIAGDHSLWMMRGDPADNGSVDLISNALGIVGRDAWCIAPDGVLYFIGTGGFYRLSPYGYQPQPESISNQKYDQFFTGLDRSSHYFGIQWDRDHHGCFIFVTAINTGVSTHLWYDLRTDSFWPISFPDSHGPISSLVYDADGPTDRVLLLGGRDGTIRQVSATNRNDDGTTINSYVILGPFKPFPGAAVLTTTQLNFGELAPADQSNPARWGVTVTLQGGVDAYSVTEGTPHVTATVDCPLERRQKFLRQRIRGGWFSVKLANSASNNYWAFESAVMDFEDGGKLREIR